MQRAVEAKDKEPELDSPSPRTRRPLSPPTVEQVRVNLTSRIGDVSQSAEEPDSRQLLIRMMGDLMESNRQNREETRAMRAEMESMKKASVLPLTMGVTTPMSLHSRFRTSATPFGSQFDAAVDGGVRRPLFVPPPAVRAPPPSTVPEESETSMPTSTGTTTAPGPSFKDPPPPKVNPPKNFSGRLAERDGAETWLGLAMNWLTIAGKNQPESVRVLMFATLLESEAHTWFQTMQQVAAGDNAELTVRELASLFPIKYVGGTTYMMRQQELTSLVYGKGKCVDVVSTQTVRGRNPRTQHDRLTARKRC